MKKSVWDFFAPLYERAMKSQKNIYEYMYQNIQAAVQGKKVLELATGPGMIAKRAAPFAQSVVATDFSPAMIEAAKKGPQMENLSFEVADATSLRFEDSSFDVVIMANALHIIPNPQKALSEIDRVLKAGGLFIAPNFIFQKNGKKNLWQKILWLAGIRFEHEWTADEYVSFLEENGWSVQRRDVVKGRIDLLYAQCVKK